MLNPFPTMWLSLLAYFILRFFVGVVLIILGYRHLKHQKELAVALKSFLNFIPRTATILLAFSELVLAVFMVTGFNTQYACLFGILMCLKLILLRGYIKTPLLPSRLFYLLLLGIFISLFITGAGAFAYDLPL